MTTNRVLVLAPRFPLPLASGTQIREYHVLRELAERFEVTLISLVQDGEGSNRVSDLATFADVHTVAHSRSKREALARFALSRQPYRVCKFTTDAFEQTVREVLASESFDLVWANFLNTVPATPQDMSCPVVLDEHNSDVRYWQSFEEGALSERMMAAINIRRVRRLRRGVANRIDGVVSVSSADAEEAREWAGNPVWILPNGVDDDRFETDTSPDDVDDTVLFVGSLDVRMNEEALIWFVENAWPHVRASCPDAVFRIVGRNPTPRIHELAGRDGVNLVGEVADVVPHYADAAVVVAPFAFGGGTKLKILEALAASRPLVTTSVGATGIPVVDGEHALVRERDEEFSDAVARLLDEPTRRRDLGAAGRSFVEERFSWDVVAERGVNAVADTVLNSET